MKFSQEPAIRQEQKQKLCLNQEMLQSLEILQMPLYELHELISRQLDENPLLEVSSGDMEQDAAVLNGEFRDVTGGKGEFTEDIADPSLGLRFTDMLLEQISAMKLVPRAAALGKYLVGCLNERGYLDIDPQILADELGVPLFDIMQALYLVQSLQPAGVGARSLQECLILQLVETKSFNSHSVRTIREGLSYLAADDLRGLAGLLGTDLKTAAECARAVRALNPIPSRGYDTDDNNRAVVPDAVIRVERERLFVVINYDIIPCLELNRDYLDMLGSGDSGARIYLKKHLRSAQSLIRAVGERNSTLRLVIEKVACRQSRFFRDGSPLVPMTISEIAEEVNRSVSTISRAVQEKYIACPTGILPLKSLFAGNASGGRSAAVSGAFVKEKIRKFIESESKQSPLSDEDIQVLLHTMEIDISRRTVAKYRAELGFAPYTHRGEKP